MVVMIKYHSYLPSQKWVSKWQNKEVGFILRAGSSGKSQNMTSLHTLDASSKPRPQLAWQHPNLWLCINQCSTSKAAMNQTIMVWPQEDLATISVVRWQPFSSSLDDQACVKYSLCLPLTPPPGPTANFLLGGWGIGNDLWLSLLWIHSPENHQVWRFQG